MKFAELKIGMTDYVTKTITAEDIDKFAEISLDKNPVHLDEEYASKTIFKKRIAHGILVSGLISAVLGTKLPGEGAIYMGQELKFMAPVFIGDTITATVEIIELIAEKNRVVFSVGHIERFNPAYNYLKENNSKIKYLELNRLAPFRTRGSDVSVLHDLMIHDLDLVNYRDNSTRYTGLIAIFEDSDYNNDLFIQNEILLLSLTIQTSMYIHVMNL